MKPIRRILVPIDFGATSSQALRRAVGLARTFDARITIVHVLDVPTYAYSGFPTVDLVTPLQDAAREELDRVIAGLSAEFPHADAVMRRGIATEEILSAIGDARADLVVMGTHGRHGVAHALLGSVAERVVRLAPVPVLTVRGRGDGSAGTGAHAKVEPLRPIRKIVVPTDFGDVANQALDEAIELAAAVDAKSVVLVHAQEYSLLGLDAGLGGMGFPDPPHRLTLAAQQSMREAIEPRRRDGLLLEGVLREGIPWNEIVALAASTQADLIVMGTHGRRGLARAFLGSVAEKVVRYSVVPVLTVRAVETAAIKTKASQDEEARSGRAP